MHIFFMLCTVDPFQIYTQLKVRMRTFGLKEGKVWRLYGSMKDEWTMSMGEDYCLFNRPMFQPTHCFISWISWFLSIFFQCKTVTKISHFYDETFQIHIKTYFWAYFIIIMASSIFHKLITFTYATIGNIQPPSWNFRECW